MNVPSITVTVCTWNRAELLRGCLETLLDQQVAPGVTWDVLVVDNNSTDHTAAVVGEYTGRLAVRRVLELEQGLSHARNRAIAETGSDYLLWTDDDVRVPRTWVQSYVDTIGDFEWPAVLGGGITPDFGDGAPAWLLAGWREVANAFAVRESPGHGAPVRAAYLPFGANYATRVDLQRAHRYDPDLGRRGAAMLSGEEEAVISQMLAEEGAAGVWLGNACVIHKIEPFRQRLSYLRTYFAGHGEVDRRRQLGESGSARQGVPRWFYRALASQYGLYLRKRYLTRDQHWLRFYTKFAFTLGEFKAWRSVS